MEMCIDAQKEEREMSGAFKWKFLTRAYPIYDPCEIYFMHNVKL